MTIHLTLGPWEDWLRDTSTHHRAISARVITALELLCKSELRPFPGETPLLLRQWWVNRKDPTTCFATREEAEALARRRQRVTIYWRKHNEKTFHRVSVRALSIARQPIHLYSNSAYVALPTTWPQQ